MDIDECTEWGERACSQTCLNTPGSYSCSCLPGYLLEPDGRICKLGGKPRGLQASGGRAVSQKALSPGMAMFPGAVGPPGAEGALCHP